MTFTSTCVIFIDKFINAIQHIAQLQHLRHVH